MVCRKEISPSDLALIAKHCLFGVDIDGKAVSIARLALIIQLSAYLQAEKNRHGVIVADKRLFELFSCLHSHVKVADSLITASAQGEDLIREDLIEQDWISCLGSF